MQGLRFLGILVVSVGLMGLTLACQPQAPPDTRAADERAIRAVMDVDCLQAAQAKDLDRRLTCFADDASQFPPNAPIVTGKEAMRALLSQFYENPGFAIGWQTTQVEVSRASDLAYSYGTYKFTLSDPGGKPVTDHGKWVAIWRKQADGTWKVVAEIWNSDLPPPGTE